MLIDTDVLIWLFRGHEQALQAIQNCESVSLSAVTYMELVQGMRSKQEFRLLRRTVHEQTWAVLPISDNVSHRAIVYIENYSLSHGLQMADALIASTAIEFGLSLMTGNHKHYKAIPELPIKRYRPNPRIES